MVLGIIEEGEVSRTPAKRGKQIPGPWIKLEKAEELNQNGTVKSAGFQAAKIETRLAVARFMWNNHEVSLTTCTQFAPTHAACVCPM